MAKESKETREIQELRGFLSKRIKELTDELAAYQGIEKILDNLPGELDPRAAKMLLEMAKRDNRFIGR